MAFLHLQLTDKTKPSSAIGDIYAGSRALTADGSLKSTLVIKTGDSQGAYEAAVMSIEFCKRVYRPCTVVAKLKVGSDMHPVEFVKALRANLIDSPAKLIYNSGKPKAKDVEVGVNYYVDEVKARFINTASTATANSATNLCDVEIVVKSLDNKLTFDKFSHVYMRQSLTEILCSGGAEAATPSGLTAKKEKYEPAGLMKKFGITGINRRPLSFLEYQRPLPAKKEDKSSSDKVNLEYIQPYLVQFDESFYDLVARTANRCGEFLYFEDGFPTLGVVTDKASKITAFRSIEVGNSAEHVTASNVTNVHFSTRDLTKGHSDITGEATASEGELKLYRSLLEGYDEYLTELEKDKFSDYNKSTSFWDKVKLGVLADMLTSTGKGKVIVAGLAAMIMPLIKEMSALMSANSNEQKAYLDVLRREQRDNDLGNEGNSEYKKGNFFGSLSTENMQKISSNIDRTYFAAVRGLEKHATEEALRMELGDYRKDTSEVGSVVEFDNELVSDKHVVVESRGFIGCRSANGAYEETFNLEMLPFRSEPVCAVPPQDAIAEARRMSPQRAIVTDNTDPFNHGCVQVRYPWQPKTKRETLAEEYRPTGGASDLPTSPWIRMATPFASGFEGGIMFRPAVGDEVMLDYENGDVDHPYVMGSLFNSYNQAPLGDREIRNRNGQCISFSEPDNGFPALTSVLGGLDFLDTLIPGATDKIPQNEVSRAFSGGITMTDRYGMFKVEMSTDQRKIDIKSPFGDVNIGAFTGITISAPNGNVKIEGKNVEIKAGNDLSIVGGINRANNMTGLYRSQHDPEKGSFEEILNDAATGIIKTLPGKLFEKVVALDLSVVRCLWDTIIPPVTAVMEVKSFRHLLISAGKGIAEYPDEHTVYFPDKEPQLAKSKYKKQADEVKALMEMLKELATDWQAMMATKYETMVNLYTNYKTAIEALTTKTPKDVANGELKSALKDSPLPDVNADSIGLKDTFRTDDNAKTAAVQTYKSARNNFVAAARSLSTFLDITQYFEGMNHGFSQYFTAENIGSGNISKFREYKLDKDYISDVGKFIDANHDELVTKYFHPYALTYIRTFTCEYLHNKLSIKAPGYGVTLDSCSDGKWLSYIGRLDFGGYWAQIGASAADAILDGIGFGDKILDKFRHYDFQGVETYQIFDEKTDGQLLLSNKSDTTVSLDKDHFAPYQNTHTGYPLTEMKEILKTLI